MVDIAKTKAILAAEQILKEVKAKNGKIIYPIKPFEYSYLNGLT